MDKFPEHGQEGEERGRKGRRPRTASLTIVGVAIAIKLGARSRQEIIMLIHPSLKRDYHPSVVDVLDSTHHEGVREQRPRCAEGRANVRDPLLDIICVAPV